MVISWNNYDWTEPPTLTLAYPDKRQIGAIHYSSLPTDLLFNGLSEISFETYKYEEGKLQEHYPYIENFMLLQMDGVGWFQITSSDPEGDGINEKKVIVAKSLENEFTTKMVTSFGELGVAEDEQGGLDMYWLYKPEDQEHSILHIVQDKNPAWLIGYVDPEITEQPRTFSDDSISSYALLVEKASELFECVFQFDTNSQTISAYKLENIGDKTNVYLSYNNLINKCNIECNSDEIKTVLFVTGGNDSTTGSNVDIIAVNPSGSNYICNFDYYKKMMSDELREALDAYETQYEEVLPDYQSAIATLNTLYDEYYDLQNKVPHTVTANSLETLISLINDASTLPSSITSILNQIDWSKYGLIELQSYLDSFEERMSMYTGLFKSGDNTTNEKRYQYNHTCFLQVETHCKARQAEIDAKKEQIDEQFELLRGLQVHIEDYVDNELMSELKRFWHEDKYVDDTCVVTTEMTDSEIIGMECELLKQATKKLSKVSRPLVQITVELDNFYEIPEFEVFKDEAKLGNIITLDLDDDIILELRLMQIHFNPCDKKDFKLVFSNKSSLNDAIDMLTEVRQQANASSGFVGINGVGVKNARNTTSEFNKYKSSVLNTSLQKLQSGENIEFEINSTGTKWRRWDDTTNAYEPYQMWGTGNGLYLTQDNWNTLSMAIGKMTIDGDIVYGVSCDVLMGDFVLTKYLSISNEDSSFNIGKDGFIASNGTNILSINPNDEDDKIFKISKIDSLTDTVEDKLYFDSMGEAHYDGNITSKSGDIGGWTISEQGLYVSNTIAQEGIGLWKANVHLDNNKYIAFHAGKDVTRIAAAPFKIYYDGTVMASNIISTGGKIGGWDIDSNSVYNTRSGMSSNLGKFAFWAGETNSKYGTSESNATFKVGHNGVLSATGANISGTITANSGVFKNVTITEGCTIASDCGINARTFGTGFIWNGNQVQNNYITQVLDSKSLQGCEVPYTSSFNIGRAFELETGIPRGDGSSEYVPGIRTLGSRPFAIKSGGCTMVVSPDGLEMHGNIKKERVVKTKTYGNLGLNALETPIPMFCDVGTGQTDNTGKCYIYIDPIFAETININKNYYVFITKYGQGDVYVSERTQNYFVVEGTPDLLFAWEIKAIQIGVSDEPWSDSFGRIEPERIDYEKDSLDYLTMFERNLLDE